MYRLGHRGKETLFVLSLLLLSGLVGVLGNAQAQGYQVVGLVYTATNCSDPATRVYLGGAQVTLTDANGLAAPSTVTTGGDGTFTFTPAAGYYSLAVEKAGYYGNITGPFRFDGTATVNKAFCMTATPASSRTLNLLVVTAASTKRGNETMSFSRTSVSSENVATTWQSGPRWVTTSHAPMADASVGLIVKFNGTTQTLGTDYLVQDYWTGTLKVLNSAAISGLNWDRSRVTYEVSYTYWNRVTRVSSYPVDDLHTVTAWKNSTLWASSNSTWTLAQDTGFLTIGGTFVDGRDRLNLTYWSVGAIGSANVSVYNGTRRVAMGTASSTGAVSFQIWPGTFEVRTTAAGYAPTITTVSTLGSNTTVKARVRMPGGLTIIGHAYGPTGGFLSAGLQGTLYNTNPAAPEGQRVVVADVVGSLYTFHAPAGTYRMIIDADGYEADNSLATLSANTSADRTLFPSEKEQYETTVVYGASDWNVLSIYRNLTLNADSTLPGLTPLGLRDLRLQIDASLDSKHDTFLGASAQANFTTWLLANGPLYTTTDGFLTTNSRAYLSNATGYTVNVEGLTSPGGKVWINTTETYGLKPGQTTIAFGAQKYFVNVTTLADANVSSYQNQTYTIVLPRTYEKVTDTIFGSLATSGFTRVVLDPDVATSSAQIRMTIERSANGTARAKVVEPTGKFSVVNVTYQNYQAFVAANTNITFSAEDSTDPVGDITEGNFTWHFRKNAADANASYNIGYGLRSKHLYNVTGEFLVNLTVTEAGGNVTYRTITVWVDGLTPVARIKTNRTGAASINGTSLQINEDQLVKFDGGLSTDLAYTGKSNPIPESGYAWDFNGDRITDMTGRTVNWSYAKPGTYKANLTVTDSVGWKSVNATITVTANDTTAPVPAFDILDPSNEYAPVTSLTENRTYSFNATRTTDNYDKASDLNYTWTIPGPIQGSTLLTHTFYGMNISFTWTKYNASYKVVLTVKDSGFGSGTPNSANVTREVVVQVDTKVRPDLRIDPVTLKVGPTNPEEGQTITLAVNVSNKAGRGVSRAVQTELYVIVEGKETLLSSQPTWFNATTGADLSSREIIAGATVRLEFTFSLTGQGNKTLRVKVWDAEEATSQVTAENEASSTVFVRQAGWVNLAIAGGVVGVLALFVAWAYIRRKIRAGEMKPIRLRRGEKGEGEEKKPRKETKEEKKRL